MRVIITDRVKIWEIKDNNTMAEVKFSTSRKVREDNKYDKVQIDNNVAKNGYISEYRSFVRFVGHAYNKLKNFKEGDLITKLNAEISREPYWDNTNNCIEYPRNDKITIFDFEKYEYNNDNNYNLDKAPKVEEEKKETVKEKTDINEDELPF